MNGLNFFLALIYIGLFSFPSAALTKTDIDIGVKIDTLLQKMTLEEKVGQMTQLTLEAVSKQPQSAETTLELDPVKLKQVIVEHHVGSVFNSFATSLSLSQWHHVVNSGQDLATKQTRLGIAVI